MIGALRHMRDAGVDAIEPTVAAQTAFVGEVDRRMRGSVWVSGGCSSWYLDRTGRNSTLWPDSSWRYSRRAARFVAAEYTRAPAAAAAADVA